MTAKQHAAQLAGALAATSDMLYTLAMKAPDLNPQVDTVQLEAARVLDAWIRHQAPPPKQPSLI